MDYKSFLWIFDNKKSGLTLSAIEVVRKYPKIK